MKTFKKLLLAVAAIVMLTALLSFSAMAVEERSGTLYDGVSYTLDAEGTLTISGNPNNWLLTPLGVSNWWDGNCSPVWKTEGWTNDVKKVVLSGKFTGLNQGALSHLYNVETVVLPSTISTISYGAFNGNKSLKHILLEGKTYSEEMLETGLYDLRCVSKLDYAFSGLAASVNTDITVFFGETTYYAGGVNEGMTKFANTVHFKLVPGSSAETDFEADTANFVFDHDSSYYTFSGSLSGTSLDWEFYFDEENVGTLKLTGSGNLYALSYVESSTQWNGGEKNLPWYTYGFSDWVKVIDAGEVTGCDSINYYIFLSLTNVEKLTIPKTIVTFGNHGDRVLAYAKNLKQILVYGAEYSEEELASNFFDFRNIKTYGAWALHACATGYSEDLTILLGTDTAYNHDTGNLDGRTGKTIYKVYSQTPAYTSAEGLKEGIEKGRNWTFDFYTHEGKLYGTNVYSFDGETGVLTITGTQGTVVSAEWPGWNNYTTAIPWIAQGWSTMITEIDVSGVVGCTKLGDLIFYKLGHLHTVTIPATLTTLSQEVFGSATNLKYIKVAGVEYTEAQLAGGVFDLRGLTNINGYAFDSASAVAGTLTVLLGDNLAEFGTNAFMQSRGADKPVVFVVNADTSAEALAKAMEAKAGNGVAAKVSVEYYPLTADKLPKALTFTGFSVRTKGYNGLRSLYSVDMNVVADVEKLGFDFLGYGALAVSSANYDPDNFGVAYDAEGNVTAIGNKVAVQSVFNNVKGIYEGKILSGGDSSNVEFALTVINFLEQNYASDIYYCGYVAYKNAAGETLVTYTDTSEYGDNFKHVNLYEISLECLKSGLINSADDVDGVVWDVLKSGAVVLTKGTDFTADGITDADGNEFGDTFTALEVTACDVVKDGDTAVKFNPTGATFTLLNDSNNNGLVVYYRPAEGVTTAHVPNRVIWNNTTGAENQLDSNWLAKVTYTVPTARPNPVFAKASVFQKVRTVVVDEGITSIGEGAFAFLPVTSIVYPESLTAIYNSAFYYCQHLDKVIRKGSKCASGTADLSGVVSVNPEGVAVSTIQTNMLFVFASKISTIILPDPVLSIASDMRQGMSSSCTIKQATKQAGVASYCSANGYTYTDLSGNLH